MSLTTPLSAADATIVSSGLITGYNRTTRVSQLATNKYAGEIQGKGSTVKVVKVNDVTVGDYVPGTPMDTQSASDSSTLLIIDQAKYINVVIDDTAINAGAGGYMDALGLSAGAKMAVTVDDHTADVMVAGAGVTSAAKLGTLAAPIDLSDPADAYAYIVNFRTALKNTSTEYAICVPSAFYGQLLQDSRFVGAGTSGLVLLNGEVGQAAGVKIVEYNFGGTPLTDNRHKVFGVSDSEAVAAVMSINKTEMYRPQDSFADAMKALCVFGAKVIRPESVASGVVTIA